MTSHNSQNPLDPRQSYVAAEVAGSRGRESLGRQVEHEVQGTEDLPERIVAQVPVFETPDYTTRLELFVEPNYDTEKFDVGPMPGQVVTMKNIVLERIAKELAEVTDVKVLIGNP